MYMCTLLGVGKVVRTSFKTSQVAVESVKGAYFVEEVFSIQFEDFCTLFPFSHLPQQSQQMPSPGTVTTVPSFSPCLEDAAAHWGMKIGGNMSR